MDGKDQALLCEGECGLWLHRGCASVPPCLYEKLSNSDEPFVCLTCANGQLKREILLLRNELKGVLELGDTIERQRLEIATLKTDSELRSDLIHQQQSKIAALEAELVQVKDEVKSLTATTVVVPPASKESTTYAAKTVTGVPRGNRRQRQSPSSRTAAGAQDHRESLTNPTTSTPHQTNTVKERVAGARRVWGTLPTTPTAAVVSTLKKLTKAGDKVRVFRKFKTNRQGKACWWFHLKGDEKDLCDLEKEWNLVILQTNWKLESCFKPQNATTVNTSAKNHIPPEHVESTDMHNRQATLNNRSLLIVELDDAKHPPATSHNISATPIEIQDPNQQGVTLDNGHSDDGQKSQV